MDVWYGNRALFGASQLDTSTNKHSLLPDMNQARSHHSSLALGKYLFVIGGMDDDNIVSSSIESLDTLRR